MYACDLILSPSTSRNQPLNAFTASLSIRFQAAGLQTRFARQICIPFFRLKLLRSAAVEWDKNQNVRPSRADQNRVLRAFDPMGRFYPNCGGMANSQFISMANQ